MKLTAYKCPECGMKIQMDVRGLEHIYCNYCGSQIRVEDNVSRKEVKIHHIYTNESEIVKHNTKRDIELARINSKKNFWDGVDKGWAMLFGFMGFMMLVGIIACIISEFGPEGREKARQIEAKAQNEALGLIYPGYDSDYKDKDYNVVVAQFKAMGFRNVEAYPLDDMNFVQKLFTNDEGKVVNVSIKGKQDFGEYDCFDPNDKVIIEYH